MPIFGNGRNNIPTVHVADLAAYVAAVCIEPPAQQYLLAVDNAQLSQREISAAIAGKMGDTPMREQTLGELYFQQVTFPCSQAFQKAVLDTKASPMPSVPATQCHCTGHMGSDVA